MTNTERQVLELIALDRINMPISSMSGKLDRRRKKTAVAIDLNPYEGDFQGDRTYARIEHEDRLKARTMREAVDEFTSDHPKYGEILNQMIEDKRSVTETHMYFGTHENCRLTADDYMGVMTSLGFTEATAQKLYPELMDISRNLSRKRGEERSIIVG